MATNVLSGEPLLMKFESAFSETDVLPSSGSKSACLLSDLPWGDRSETFTNSFEADLESKSEVEEEEEDDDDDDEDDYDPLAYFEFDESDNEISNEILCWELPKYMERYSDWPDILTFEDSLQYSKEVKASNGFDVKVVRFKYARRNGLIQPAFSITAKNINNIASCSKAAVKRENHRRSLYNKYNDEKLNDHLKLKGVIKAMSQYVCREFLYYLTIKVLEGEHEVVYETMMRLDPPPCRGEWGKFRVKGTRVRFVEDYKPQT